MIAETLIKTLVGLVTLIIGFAIMISMGFLGAHLGVLIDDLAAKLLGEKSGEILVGGCLIVFVVMSLVMAYAIGAYILLLMKGG